MRALRDPRPSRLGPRALQATRRSTRMYMIDSDFGRFQNPKLCSPRTPEAPNSIPRNPINPLSHSQTLPNQLYTALTALSLKPYTPFLDLVLGPEVPRAEVAAVRWGGSGACVHACSRGRQHRSGRICWLPGAHLAIWRPRKAHAAMPRRLPHRSFQG